MSDFHTRVVEILTTDGTLEKQTEREKPGPGSRKKGGKSSGNRQVAVAPTSLPALSPLPPPPPSLLFSLPELLSPDFQVDSFIAVAKKAAELKGAAADAPARGPSKDGAALEAVVSQLAATRQYLDQVLLALVSAKYESFMSLSADLSAARAALGEMREPLVAEETALAARHHRLSSAHALLATRTSQHLALLRQQRTLKLAKVGLQALASAETLLGVGASVSPLLALDAEAEANVVERVASEYNEIQFCLGQVEHLPLGRAMGARLRRVEETLLQSLTRLCRSLLTRVRGGDAALLHGPFMKQLLRSYVAVDRARDAEALYREVVVAPAVDDAYGGQSVDSPDSLITTLDALRTFVQGPTCAPLLHVNAAYLTPFNFLGNAVWPEVSSSLMTKAAVSFRSGVPDQFAKSYTAIETFMNEVRDRLATVERRRHFDEGQATRALLKRFNLPIYYQLRFQEVAGLLSTALATNAAADQVDPSTEPSEYALTSTKALLQSLRACLSPSIYLHVLGRRFVRLCLQCIARFGTWVRDGLRLQRDSDSEASPAAADHKGGPDDSSPSIFSAPYLPLLYADLSRLVAGLPTATDYFAQTLGKFSESERKTLRAAVSVGSSELRSRADAVVDAIVGEAQDRVRVALGEVKTIASTYRMTNRPAPTTASPYLAAVLAPLRELIDPAISLPDALAASLTPTHFPPQATLQAWLSRVADTTAALFAEQLTELLATVKKTDVFLRRLTKKGGDKERDAGGAAASPALTDADKIRAQVRLDVQTLVEVVKEGGVDTRPLAGFVSLCRVLDEA